jgi:hypothetical protein
MCPNRGTKRVQGQQCFFNKACSHILFSFQCNSQSMVYIFVSKGQNRTLWATFLRFSYWRACFVGQFLAGCGL